MRVAEAGLDPLMRIFSNRVMSTARHFSFTLQKEKLSWTAITLKTKSLTQPHEAVKTRRFLLDSLLL